MSKLSIKPAWVAAAALLAALAVAIRFAMAITAFTPASRPLTATTSTRMTISGTNLATATSVTLFINGTLTKYVITTFVSRAATSVVINTPAIMAPGLYQVRVDTPGGFGLSPAAFRSL